MMHPVVVQLVLILIKIVCLLVAIAYFTIAERKIMAAIQRRRGPNVVGFWGLLQPLADGLKLIAKEMVIPSHSNSRIFVIAPLCVLTLGLLNWSILPFGSFDYSEYASVNEIVTSGVSFGDVKKAGVLQWFVEVCTENLPVLITLYKGGAPAVSLIYKGVGASSYWVVDGITSCLMAPTTIIGVVATYAGVCADACVVGGLIGLVLSELQRNNVSPVISTQNSVVSKTLDENSVTLIEAGPTTTELLLVIIVILLLANLALQIDNRIRTSGSISKETSQTSDASCKDVKKVVVSDEKNSNVEAVTALSAAETKSDKDITTTEVEPVVKFKQSSPALVLLIFLIFCLCITNPYLISTFDWFISQVVAFALKCYENLYVLRMHLYNFKETLSFLEEQMRSVLNLENWRMLVKILGPKALRNLFLLTLFVWILFLFCLICLVGAIYLGYLLCRKLYKIWKDKRGRMAVGAATENTTNFDSIVESEANEKIEMSFDFLAESNMISDVRYGLLVILALSSLTVYGLIIAGWASNSKYAFLGALRSAAQMISYEVSISLVLIPVIFMSGSLNFTEIVTAQITTVWYVLPLAPLAIIFFISMIAETNRTPFDLPEAEAELVAGYNVEYSSIIFAMFFLAEYGNMIMMSLIKSELFIGGWAGPAFVPSSTLVALKALVFCFLFVLVRATFPRYRYDQLMDIGWKIFLPLTTGLLLLFIGLLMAYDVAPVVAELELSQFYSTKLSGFVPDMAIVEKKREIVSDLEAKLYVLQSLYDSGRQLEDLLISKLTNYSTLSVEEYRSVKAERRLVVKAINDYWFELTQVQGALDEASWSLHKSLKGPNFIERGFTWVYNNPKEAAGYTLLVVVGIVTVVCTAKAVNNSYAGTKMTKNTSSLDSDAFGIKEMFEINTTTTGPTSSAPLLETVASMSTSSAPLRVNYDEIQNKFYEVSIELSTLGESALAAAKINTANLQFTKTLLAQVGPEVNLVASTPGAGMGSRIGGHTVAQSYTMLVNSWNKFTDSNTKAKRLVELFYDKFQEVDTHCSSLMPQLEKMVLLGEQMTNASSFKESVTRNNEALRVFTEAKEAGG